MSNRDPKADWSNWLKDGGVSAPGPELDLRDYVFFLDSNLDIESQMIAIHGLLIRNRQADAALTNEIKEIEEHARTLSDRLNQRAVDEWIDRLHHSVYQDAAHSMAAVGMLAPLIESIFAQCFQAIGRKYFQPKQYGPPHIRWKAAKGIAARAETPFPELCFSTVKNACSRS